jgi:hypothetical protein
MAATGGPSFLIATADAAFPVTDAATEVVVVEKVLDALVALVLNARTLLVELVPPTAPYADLNPSLSKYAGARFAALQPLVHAPILQHPMNGGLVKEQV